MCHAYSSCNKNRRFYIVVLVDVSLDLPSQTINYNNYTETNVCVIDMMTTSGSGREFDCIFILGGLGVTAAI